MMTGEMYKQQLAIALKRIEEIIKEDKKGKVIIFIDSKDKKKITRIERLTVD